MLLMACENGSKVTETTPETDSASETEAASVTDGASETEAASVTEAASETEAASDTDSEETVGESDTAEPLPAACEAADPSVSAAFELLLVDWPDATSETHEIAVNCVVDKLEVGEMTTSELLCDVDGVQRAATLKYAAPEIAEDYLAGEQVHLVSKATDWSELGMGVMGQVALRSAVDDRLLIAGVRDEILDDGPFAPLVVESELVCGPEVFDGTPRSMQLNFAMPDAPVLGVIGGHSGLLEGDGFAYDIDVESARINECCHFLRFHEVLVRRVIVGG